ncbi:hypothetical protein Pan153_63220 [Gimesia panareensis]|uniref:DUF4149 domain-containing protein n=1 Tax=Gimesia panareensis TaxID=2527978 RepID=A0A518FZ48_9PLAN|nr:hypothetical protein [Gimesia panareensis]QDV21632.1 hypothetical protein Pan153_63220 [Gimesia panareensis]
MQENHSSSHSPGSLVALRHAIWPYILCLVWGIWWGGLCFYAVVVVPIGTELIGSVEQGFITQQVTQWHNALSILAVLCLCIEAGRRQSRLLWGTGAILAIVVVCEFVWHIHLTALMDFQDQSVPEHFYGAHAIYLWMTAVEWGIGLLLPVYFFASGAEQMKSVESESTQ